MSAPTCSPIARRGVALLALVACSSARPRPEGPPAADLVPYVYVGGYRPEILVFRLDLEAGKLIPAGRAPAGTDPSFLAWDPQRRFLFASNETDPGRVRSFAIDPASGALTPINDLPSGGSITAHLSTDAAGRWLLVANYGDQKTGTLVSFPIGPDGRLGAAVDTHDLGLAVRPHLIRTDPTNRFALVPCKGGPYVAQFALDAATGKLAPNTPARVEATPGSGPRHLDFHPNGRWVYVNEEQGLRVVLHDYDARTGTLQSRQAVGTLPPDANPAGASTAHLQVHPSGRFLYVSNRGHNSLAIFRIDPATGQLTLAGHERRTIRRPRNFHIEPGGRLLLVANQDGASVSIFRIDQATGLLSLVGEPTPAGANPAFVGVVMLPGRPAPSRSPLEGLGPVELVRSGFAFVEGLRWLPERQVMLVSDAYGETVYQLTPPDRWEPFRPASNGANGLDLDAGGHLVAAEVGGARETRPGAVSRLRADGIWVDAIADYRGLSLGHPNDVVALPDGHLFFSDLAQRHRLFRIDPRGALSHPLEWGDEHMNGLALSPDKKILYAGGGGVVQVFDVTNGGLVRRRAPLRTEPKPDGMCVDADGNLYVGTQRGVQVFAPESGQVWGLIPLPGLGPDDRATECAFGDGDGRSLYISARSKLFRVRTRQRGPEEQAFTGFWRGVHERPDGGRPLFDLSLRVAGGRVTGTVFGGGKPTEILSGTASTALTITTTARTYSGKIVAGELHLGLSDRPGAIVAHRLSFDPTPPPIVDPPLPAPRPVPPNGLAATPPMGWNSWNRFRTAVDDRLIRETADALVATGLQRAGYVYLNIDDGWEGERDAAGNLQPNARFPDMRALADYVHGKGLRLGLYSSPGPRTCAGFTGSFGHEVADARTFARWGIDYLKYDWCSAHRVYNPGQMRAAYQLMGQALAEAGRPIVYSLCQYGLEGVTGWAAQVGGNLWRTTEDIRDSWGSVEQIGFDAQDGLAPHAGPGHWNDPDMLEVGNGGLSDAEAHTHFSLWALLAAPLIAGNDVRAMTGATRAILTNVEVIAVDQDRLGLQGRRTTSDGTREVWARTLTGGAVAVGLFNRGSQPATVVARWSDLGLRGRWNVRDLWAHADRGPATGEVRAEVGPHGVVLLRLWR
jgi:alpha-galactosidase